MQKEFELKISPEQSEDATYIVSTLAKASGCTPKEISHYQIVRKSIDSRSRFPVVLMKIRAFINEEENYTYQNSFTYPKVNGQPEVIIVGAGPAGLFAALRLIELNLKPILIERGKDILERKQDVAELNKNLGLDTESNYCYGAGGAGTFSDGKLFTRSKKRGNAQRILEIFHHFGAQNDVLYEARPHIGTDKLPTIIKNMCTKIIACGGEIHFQSKMKHFLLDGEQITGIELSDGTQYKSKQVILATGHSASDIYYMMYEQNIPLEAKGFAMGVRVEHPQKYIDKIQYHSPQRNPHLPPATYNLVSQVQGRGVYSFCMCPGGWIVPSATAEGQIVINGMSNNLRNSPFANAGVVVEIHPEDIPQYDEFGPLKGLKFQEEFERLAFVNNGGQGQKAPAQCLGDFVDGHLSNDLPECSYLPGLISSPLHFWMPEFIAKRLQQGFIEFNKKMHGFITNEAVIVGVESRTSSPVRIPRDRTTLQHTTIKGLYPCGEGAGYAGGISSSAMDGEKAAEQIALSLGGFNPQRKSRLTGNNYKHNRTQYYEKDFTSPSLMPPYDVLWLGSNWPLCLCRFGSKAPNKKSE